MGQAYRCYFVGADGHFIARAEFESASPAEAIKSCIELLAKREPGCTGFELWEGDRRIHAHRRRAKA
ncbi:MAG TPA: hypothetical protein VFC38_10300 [Stellaceae bacterium]|nr:hypothetical protein [Stellaceae bacterium]